MRKTTIVADADGKVFFLRDATATRDSRRASPSLYVHELDETTHARAFSGKTSKSLHARSSSGAMRTSTVELCRSPSARV